MKTRKRADRFFLWIVVGLILLGSFIFVSAWLGLLARDENRYNIVLFKQAISVVLGFIALIGISNVPYSFWKKYSFYIFIASFLFTLLVFVPGISMGETGGARRWISFGSISLQPSEFLKIGFIIYFAALLSSLKEKIHSFTEGILPIIVIIILIASLLLAQPNTSTLVVILASGLGMFIAAGGRWRYVVSAGALGLVGLAFLAFTRPYVMSRFLTFFDPSKDALNAGWQIKQSLIAIGSGGVVGRGFGQSVQKFNYLPEPIGDSIFAVAAEEFGFIGAVAIITLFVMLALRGLHIAKNAPNQFSGLLVVGIVILVVTQSFINIAAMLGVLPLTGIPLLFISHGGTALVFIMCAMGIILNVSKHITS